MGLTGVPPDLFPVDPTLPGAADAADFPVIEFNDTATGVHQVILLEDILDELPIDGST